MRKYLVWLPVIGWLFYKTERDYREDKIDKPVELVINAIYQVVTTFIFLYFVVNRMLFWAIRHIF